MELGSTNQGSRRESPQVGGTTTSEPPRQTQELASGLNVNAAPFPPQDSTRSLYVTTNKAMLLHAGRHKPRCSTLTTRRCLEMFMLYLTLEVSAEEAARALSLESEGVRRMSIFAFGFSNITLSECHLVRVMLRTLDGGKGLHLLTTPIICEPLTAQPLTLCANVYRHLSGLESADPSDGRSAIEVDLLMGSDYYWELVMEGSAAE